MKVVIDTNVVISAAIADRNPEKIILFVVSNPDFYWIVSPDILAEYREVLSRKRLKLTNEQKQYWLTLTSAVTFVVDINLEIDFPRDRKDAKFLACGIVNNADYFITGDKDFDEVKNLGHTKIISVSLFQTKYQIK